MVKKQQWIELPAKILKDMFGLWLSPLYLLLQYGSQDRMISDSSYFDLNQDMLKIAHIKSMEFGLLFCIQHANKHFSPAYMSKMDLLLVLSFNPATP